MKFLCILLLIGNFIFAGLWIDSKIEGHEARIEKLESDQKWAGQQFSLRLQMNRLMDSLIAAGKKISELEKEIEELKGPVI